MPSGKKHVKVKVTPIWRLDEARIVAADAPSDLVRIAGAKYEITGSGRIHLA